MTRHPAPIGVEPSHGGLHDLVVVEALRDAVPFQQLELRGPGGSVLAGRVSSQGCVLPRAVLDARLVAAAEARGATLVQERITQFEDRGGYVALNRHLAARVVVGADGANSAVRRQLGVRSQPRQHRGVALRGYATAPDRATRLDFRFQTDLWPSYAWCFPGPRDRANVGVVALDGRSPLSRRRLVEVLDGWPSLPRPDPQTVRGHRLPLARAGPELGNGRALLAGDAAALVNPLSGEGIAAALLSGALAGECAVRYTDPAAAYRYRLRRRLRRHLRHVRLASRVYESPALVDEVLRAASRSERVFDDLVALSVGTRHLSPVTGLRMALHLARGALHRNGPGTVPPRTDR